jgi:hypothetical protein
MSVCKPHTIAVCRMYALRGYPGTRLDVGLSTYRRFAAGGHKTEKLHLTI